MLAKMLKQTGLIEPRCYQGVGEIINISRYCDILPHNTVLMFSRQQEISLHYNIKSFSEIDNFQEEQFSIAGFSFRCTQICFLQYLTKYSLLALLYWAINHTYTCLLYLTLNIYIYIISHLFKSFWNELRT